MGTPPSGVNDAGPAVRCNDTLDGLPHVATRRACGAVTAGRRDRIELTADASVREGRRQALDGVAAYHEPITARGETIAPADHQCVGMRTDPVAGPVATANPGQRRMGALRGKGVASRGGIEQEVGRRNEALPLPTLCPRSKLYVVADDSDHIWDGRRLNHSGVDRATRRSARRQGEDRGHQCAVGLIHVGWRERFGAI